MREGGDEGPRRVDQRAPDPLAVGGGDEQAVGVVHLGAVVVGAAGWFSPLRNMLVSGAMPSVATGARRNRRACTSSTVSVPGRTTKR